MGNASREPKRRRRTVWFGVVSAMIAGAWVAPGAVAATGGHRPAARAAGTVQSADMTTGAQSLTTSKHKNVKVSIYADDYDTVGTYCNSENPHATDDFQVYLSSKSRQNGTEWHDWGLQIPCSAFVWNGDKARLHISKHDMGPFGAVDLTYRNAKTGKNKCGSQSDHGTLSGTFRFKPGGAYGKLGSAKFTFKKATLNYVLTSGGGGKGCSGNKRLPCPKVTSYGFEYESASFLTSAEGFAESSTGSFSATRSVDLSKPAGATRTDMVTPKRVPASITSSSKQVAIKIAPQGKLLTGTATFKTKGKRDSSKQQCYAGGKKKKFTAFYWSGGTMANGSKPLKAHPVYGSGWTFPSRKAHVSLGEEHKV
jgi:hypothetical protein